MSKKTTILCIEDEPMLLDDLREELEDSGYDVLTAENGKLAVKMLQDNKPDLILCDMMMPEMDGPATLNHIRKNCAKLNSVPFIFLTAKATRDDIIAGKKLGVDDYLIKPVDFDLLLATIDSSLAQVQRIEKTNHQKLRKLYEAYQQEKTGSGPIRITFVTGNTNSIAPIKSALLELGCDVSIVLEDQLAKKNFSAQDCDIIFLAYSKTVHYYLKYVSEGRSNKSGAKMILLAPPKLTQDQTSALLQYGIDNCIEYPYPPVEVFKLIMDHMKPSQNSLAAR